MRETPKRGRRPRGREYARAKNTTVERPLGQSSAHPHHEVVHRVELLVVTENGHGDGKGSLRGTPNDAALPPRITTLRVTLAAADAALGLVAELPADTTGPLIEAVRKRLAAALDALDAVEHSDNGHQSPK